MSLKTAARSTANPFSPELLEGLVLDELGLISAEKCRRSLREYVRQAWPIVEPGTPFVPGWHLDAICDHLQALKTGQIRNLIINIRPRSSKSLVSSVFFPTWLWTDDPTFRLLWSSYAQPLATRDARKSRNIIEHPWYQARWGLLAQHRIIKQPDGTQVDKRVILTSDQNEKMRYENSATGYRIAMGVGGSVTGEGGDIVAVDDPHKVKERESDEVRTGVLDWWDTSMSTRLNNANTGRKLVVMQRVHEQDLTGHLLEQGGWEHLCLPTEYEPTTRVTSIGFTDPRSQPGELLDPERFGPVAVTEAKRVLGSTAYAGQHQQRPAPAEGNRFKRIWFRYWHPKGMKPAPVPVQTEKGLVMVDSVELPDGLEKHTQSWDCAFKDTDGSDYVCGGVLAKAGPNAYLLDLVRRHMGFQQTVVAVELMRAKWPQATQILIEDKANGPAVIETLTKKIHGVIACSPMGGKESRASACEPFVEAGNLYVPHPSVAPWVDAYLNEMIVFPNGSHDDQVDMTTQALIKIFVLGSGLMIYAA